jgi:hypothetical protein
MTIKLKFNEQQQVYIETMAVQNIIKKLVGEAVAKRMAEIDTELSTADGEVTNAEIEQKYLGHIPKYTASVLVPH